ncbi:MAG: hypothetical protein IPK37_02670 [Austwickia sp.]|nr:MAG: hypothetical protein IPK37_02670 [Austwickia sp.]
MSVQTGRRGELFAYLAIIAVNLLVLPNWFSPGRFALAARLGFIALSVLVIAFCAWRITGILGVSPFTKRKHPQYAPYGVDDEDDGAEDAGPFAAARRRRQEARSWGQSEDFEEYDPYDDAPDASHEHDRREAREAREAPDDPGDRDTRGRRP